MERRKEERREAKGKEFLYIILLILFISILFLKPNDRKDTKNIENSDKKTDSSETQNLSSEHLIKFELLRGRYLEEKEGRNIFQPIRPMVKPQIQEQKIEERIEEELIIPFKLICIIEELNSENSRYAILSKGEDIVIAKKGDILEGELEILNVEEEGVVFKSLKNGKEKRIVFEEK